MPVYNPKTGEQDYVDITLVNKIVVDSEYIEDMITNNKLKIDLSLTGDEEKNEVHLIARNENLNMKEVEIIPLQSFEEMLFKAIHEVKDQRLEDVEEFKNITSKLINQFIDRSRAEQKHFARLETEYKLTNGVGIIRDTKTNQDVGTFESFEYFYAKNTRSASIQGIILSGRSFEDLEEKDRFEFCFYSLDHRTAYSLMAGDRASIKAYTEKVEVNIEKYGLVTEVFDEQHKYYAMVTTAQAKKALIEGIDENHPLYDTNMGQFRQSRLDILEESKNRQKEEKLIQQFADIDLDF